jgi:hypothetical protein
LYNKVWAPFIRELVDNQKPDLESVYQQYYRETMRAMDAGQGLNDEDGKSHLIYGFKSSLNNVIKETNAPFVEIDPEEIHGGF